MERLRRYFLEGVADCELGETVGAEIETSFVDFTGRPLHAKHSQEILLRHIQRHNWKIRGLKGGLISEIANEDGDRILYELGSQNIELATRPLPRKKIIQHTKKLLHGMYCVADALDAYPRFKPILNTDENLLIIPDERDATWLELDGRPALELLARISSVQFTISVPPEKAIFYLNRLGESIDTFLVDYEQEEHWKKYIAESKAGYNSLRYGGPLIFRDMDDYCEKLAEHSVVCNGKLLPYHHVKDLNIPLFLRSIWWYFRLRRYGNTLCIEVRPQSRLNDRKLKGQLERIFQILE